ncbi:hypothetical protein [Dyadobacter sp. CY326]|uniref:hypothetical protein n=1 Tax=Dyadobacter sp. CY326 TaxID=2907300 RepID=UPI001F1C2D19|nr:hypothetical protein [Dyadobacter sp. CY326]MCE7064877.1 hypothetical protein [Dyadobacter sp. CY326]
MKIFSASIIFWLISYATNSFAQIVKTPVDSVKSIDKPTLSLSSQEHIPQPPKTVQSPNAATLGSYGEIAVSPYTGKANISIDLHSVSDGNIQIPVSLHYDAAGVRPDVHPGWTGLNFGLIRKLYLLTSKLDLLNEIWYCIINAYMFLVFQRNYLRRTCSAIEKSSVFDYCKGIAFFRNVI